MSWVCDFLSTPQSLCCAVFSEDSIADTFCKIRKPEKLAGSAHSLMRGINFSTGYPMKNGLPAVPSRFLSFEGSDCIHFRGLKSIPPLSARRKQDEIDLQRVEVIYPPSVIKENRIPEIIKKLATERNDIHRSRLIWSIVGMPIVAPFALVPIIPNVYISGICWLCYGALI